MPGGETPEAALTMAVRPLRWLLAGTLVCGLLAACRHPRTPEQACEDFLRAVSEGDGGSVFDSLLETTRWAFFTVQKNHREMRQLVGDTYPPAERTAALARLYGADAESGRDLFIQIYPERYAAAWTSRLGSGEPRLVPSPDSTAGQASEFLCQRSSGQPFRIRRTASGKWGMSELNSEWEQAQLRAIHDLETVKKNADLYRRLSASPTK